MDVPYIQANLVAWSDVLRQSLQFLAPAAFNLRRMAIIAMLDRCRVLLSPPNGFNRFCSLPSSILCSVLERLPPFDRLSLSQTCQRLRYYVLDHAELWNDLSGIMYYPLDDLHALQCVEKLVDRASPGPLRLTILVNVWDAQQRDTAFKSAEAHLSRLSHLNLMLSRTHIYRADQEAVHADALRSLAACLSSPAPILQSLSIFICEDCCLASLPLDAGIFDGTAPKLTRCSLKNVSLSATRYPALTNLTTVVYAPQSREIDVPVFNQLLLSCPRLQNLALYVEDFRTLTGVHDNGAHAHTALQNILVDWVAEGFQELLTRLMQLPLQNLVFPSQPDVEDWNRFLSLFTVSHLALGIATCEADTQYSESDQSVRLRFAINRFDFSVHNLLHEMGPSYRQLTSLAIHEYFWPRHRALPEVASVTSLRIMLASCCDVAMRSRYHGHTCGIFQARPDTAWSVPGLRELHLSYWLSAWCCRPHKFCCCSRRLSLSLSDVHYFVTSCLRFRSTHISNITLSGVEVIDLLPAPWLERLGDLAEDVIFSSSSTPTPADAPSGVWDGDFEDLFRESLFDAC